MSLSTLDRHTQNGPGHQGPFAHAKHASLPRLSADRCAAGSNLASHGRFRGRIRREFDHDQVVAISINLKAGAQLRQTDRPTSSGDRCKLGRVGTILRFGSAQPFKADVEVGKGNGLVRPLEDADAYDRAVTRRGIRRVAHYPPTPAHNRGDRGRRGGRGWRTPHHIRGLKSNCRFCADCENQTHEQQRRESYCTDKPETLQTDPPPML